MTFCMLYKYEIYYFEIAILCCCIRMIKSLRRMTSTTVVFRSTHTYSLYCMFTFCFVIFVHNFILYVLELILKDIKSDVLCLNLIAGYGSKPYSLQTAEMLHHRPSSIVFRSESNMFKTLPKTLSGISQNFHLLCSSMFP